MMLSPTAFENCIAACSHNTATTNRVHSPGVIHSCIACFGKQN